MSETVEPWAGEWEGIVRGVMSRSGRSKNGPWTLYTVRGHDGREFSTFDKGDAMIAERAVGFRVRIAWENHGHTTQSIFSIEFIGPANG
jgi:hypothetical protein